MKKSVLLLIAFMGFSVSAHANLIDLPSFVSGGDVSISNLQTQSTTVENWANGNVEGGGINIKAGSITSQDLSTTISPVTRWDEAFNDFTFSGMLPATDSDLTSDISAGVSYVSGYRISTSATAHTYTASKDTYVYIHKGGYFVYQEVANGAAAPSTPADTLLLAKAVTSGTQITSVSDLRTTSIQIQTTTTNFPADYRSQAYVSRDTTTTLHFEPGQIAIGNTIYSRTSDTSAKSITTGTNWIEGSVPNTTSGIGIFLYAYNDAGSTWDFKYSSADPVYSDTSLNNGGTLRYYTTGGTTYRALAWAYISADTVQLHEFGNFKDATVSNYSKVFTSSTYTLTSTVSQDVAGLLVNFYSSGRPVRLKCIMGGPDNGGAVQQATTNFNSDGTALLDSEAINGTNSSTGYTMALANEYVADLPQGKHRLKVQARVDANGIIFKQRRFLIEEL